MFWNKKDCLEDYVNCEECGVVVLKRKSYSVLRIYNSLTFLDSNNEERAYYCETHRRKYDKVIYGYSQIKYLTWIETDKEGKPVKK